MLIANCEFFCRATELRPDDAEAHYELGNLLRQEERPDEALAAYQTALRLGADSPDVHLRIAVVLHNLRRFDEAVVHFREVLRADPKRTGVEWMAARALLGAGRVGEARGVLEQAAAGADADSILRHPISRLFRETLTELIPPDHAAIEEYKARVSAAVRAFASQPGRLDLSKLHTHGALPSAMLAYYGGNVRPIIEEYARAIGPRIPRSVLLPRRGKPKLGIMITRGFEGVFARCWGGIAERLSRELFDVRLLVSRGRAKVLQSMVKVPEHEFVCLPDAVDEAARVLHEQAFDWLHYWEIGTDAMNYYLPFFQLAPGQSTCWGWPVTSGNPCVTSYISCEQWEPPDAASHYSEQLILFRRLPTYFIRLPAPRGPLVRSRFGLGDRQRVYVCTQGLQKYHPDFDVLLATLLRDDPEGLLVMVGDRQQSITNLLLDRFRRTMPDVLSRVRVMPWMEPNEYLALVADVALDTLHFGAGVTAYDAVSVGTPFITLPGEFQRSRCATAINRRLGLEQLIASTPQEYVAKAIEVASNPHLRHSLHKQILDAGAELFEDAAVVREHEEYFSQAIATTREG